MRIQTNHFADRFRPTHYDLGVQLLHVPALLMLNLRESECMVYQGLVLPSNRWYFPLLSTCMMQNRYVAERKEYVAHMENIGTETYAEKHACLGNFCPAGTTKQAKSQRNLPSKGRFISQSLSLTFATTADSARPLEMDMAMS